MGRMRYSADVSLEDYLIFSHDELDIECEILAMTSADAEADDQILSEYRAALLRVDDLKLTGAYETFRREIGGAVAGQAEKAKADFISRNPALSAYFDGDAEAVKGLDHVSNLFAGLKSPDPEQRARFRALYDVMNLAMKSPSDVEHLLPVLERAKRRKGRPSLRTPWENEEGNMEKIRALVFSGKSPLGAAAEVAAAEGGAGAEERAKSLARLYRAKRDLRKKLEGN